MNEDRCTKDRCFQSVMSTNAVAVRYQMAPFFWNDEVRRLTGPKLTAIVQSRHLTLFEHIVCMADNVDAKRILSTLPLEDWRRPQGRPHITRLSTIQQDLRYHNLTLPEAMYMAQNWSLWRMWSTYGAMQSCVACQKRRRLLRVVLWWDVSGTLLWLTAVQSSGINAGSGWCAHDVTVDITVWQCRHCQRRSWTVTHVWSKASLPIVDTKYRQWFMVCVVALLLFSVVIV